MSFTTIVCIVVALTIASDADHDLLEPPWQWGRIIAICMCIFVALTAAAFDRWDRQ